jgi:hypothetical protein
MKSKQAKRPRKQLHNRNRRSKNREVLLQGVDGSFTKYQTEQQRLERYLLLPGGLVSEAQVHLIDKEHRIEHSTSGFQKLDRANNIIEQVVPQNPASEHLQLPGSWMLDAHWQNPPGAPPVSTFKVTFKVPDLPPTQSGQTIFLFPGIERAEQGDILQPVLQYGYGGPLGGGAQWYVYSYFIRQGGEPLRSKLLTSVNVGEVLTASIFLEPNSQNRLDYRCGFENKEDSFLEGTTDGEIGTGTWLFLTLESYNAYASDFYPQTQTTFSNIEVTRTDGTTPAIAWKTEKVNRFFAGTIDAVNNGSTNSSIEIKYNSDS